MEDFHLKIFMSKLELNIVKDKIDFKVLYRIVKLNIDKVTLKKYDVIRSLSERGDNFEIVNLGKEIGELTVNVLPEVAVEVSKMIGNVVKDFKIELAGKKKKKSVISEIIKI